MTFQREDGPGKYRGGRPVEAPDLGERLPGWRARWSDRPGRLALVLADQRLILLARKVPRKVPSRLLDEIEHYLAGGDSPHCRDRAPLAALPDELADVPALEQGPGERDADAG